MAPEQLAGARQVDGRADLYAFGVVLYELLIGRVPFQGETEWQVMAQIMQAPPPPPRQLNPALSEAIQAELVRALAKQPEGRPATGAAFLAAITAASKPGRDRSVAAGQEAPPKSTKPAARRGKARSGTAQGAAPTVAPATVLPEVSAEQTGWLGAPDEEYQVSLPSVVNWTRVALALAVVAVLGFLVMATLTEMVASVGQPNIPAQATAAGPRLTPTATREVIQNIR
jgi:serine/threonine-protein kinase